MYLGTHVKSLDLDGHRKVEFRLGQGKFVHTSIPYLQVAKCLAKLLEGAPTVDYLVHLQTRGIGRSATLAFDFAR